MQFPSIHSFQFTVSRVLESVIVRCCCVFCTYLLTSMQCKHAQYVHFRHTARSCTVCSLLLRLFITPIHFNVIYINSLLLLSIHSILLIRSSFPLATPMTRHRPYPPSLLSSLFTFTYVWVWKSDNGRKQTIMTKLFHCTYTSRRNSPYAESWRGRR